MNRQKPILFIAVLTLIGITAGMLVHAKSSQTLGLPGVKTRPLAASRNLEVLLPETVPGYTSEPRPQADIVTNSLPRDTSFGQRLYTADDGFQSLANVVLMGSSRDSIHDPQICLTAQGWTINNPASRVEMIHLDKPVSYDLPVMRLRCLREGQINGQKVAEAGVYVYWFVDAGQYTAVRSRLMITMLRDMMFKDVLDRWAYVAYFAVCPPGQEDATFDRIKKLIAASVPEFQLVPQAAK
jgi:hypothetical protein